MSRIRVAARPPRPLLLFDGDCGFCRLWLERWKSATGGFVDYEPAQEAAERFPEIPPDAFHRSVQLVTPEGEIFEGAEAIFRSFAAAPGRGRLLAAYRALPGFSFLTELAYRFVARHRGAASVVTRALWGRHVEKPRYSVAGDLFLRFLGLSYFAAFVSLWVQVDGLIGSRGILPAGRFLDWVASQLGSERFNLFPTLCWFGAGDGFLNFLCGAGAALSLLLVAGFAPALCLALLWVFYLSLSVASQTFLEFQWDLLLLEAGFLAIFFASWRIRPGFARHSPSPTVFFLLKWLLFRLIFSSGAVKLTSGDSAWRHLAALRYHYETQPLPPWTAWYFHRLPAFFQAASVAFVFVVELAVPFLLFAPRRPRLFAFGALMSLQFLIAGTGNYAFFNLLTVGLCLLLLDDAVFPERWRARPVSRSGSPAWLIAPIALVTLLATSVHFAGAIKPSFRPPESLVRLAAWMAPFRSTNGYGLFMVMTTSRPEILIEGSDDGATWLPYEFRWKPGDLKRRPRFVAPHQPRLDWQMWFAALGRCEENPWFVNFLARLLQGSPPVVRLLAGNPFPDHPPRYIRAVLYDYRFTDAATRRATGAWWKREERGLYCPVLSREMLRPGN